MVNLEEKPAHPILGNQQLNDFRRWALAPSTRKADVIILASPVPVAFLPVEEILRLLKEIRDAAPVAGALDTAKEWSKYGGPLGAIFGGVAGYVFAEDKVDIKFKEHGLSDLFALDLADMWTQKDNQIDLVEVLDTLFGLANDLDENGNPGPHRRVVIILGGDVHCAAIHLLRSTKNEHRWQNCIYQVTASAISKSPPNDPQFEQLARHFQSGKSISASDLLRADLDIGKLSAEKFGADNAKFILDDQLGSHYTTELMHLHVGRSFGEIDVQKLGNGSTFRVRLSVDVNDINKRSIHNQLFDLRLDDALVSPREVDKA
jgi:hypothetical protein